MKYEKTMDLHIQEIQKNDSDADSFHSAISTAPERDPVCRSKQERPTKSKSHMRESRSGTQSTHPRSNSLGSIDTENTCSRPSSGRSRRSSVSKSRRESSIAKKKPPRTELAMRHRQLFSSLDGVLALSRDGTPLPSAPTSQTSSRQASIIAESSSGSSNADTVQRICETIDAKLQLAQAQHRLLPAPSIHSSSSSFAGRDESRLTTQSQVSPRMSMSQDTLQDISSTSIRDWRYKNNSSGIVTLPSTHQHSRQDPQFDVVMSWTSDATRRSEYAKIDRAHSGFHGLFRRLLPRSLCRNARRGFFTGDCDGDSVRRFRIGVSDEVEDDDRSICHPSQEGCG
ncbi:hypothetical protein A1O1_05499 [Capronia coronata CBS 617.96]|uniref:Uncharacterized protein n=1 Tax=Capronia coronata CBS 617.96 TaxID=1182541 RepID=W9Z233_9EURO|nr:uncharacterized protein A1O1_05499 [Capronia coronata CBS 617.96]EXJ88569.1 hypothetical protein A1O1_05499 [Capronia coronata CBS 617.96]